MAQDSDSRRVVYVYGAPSLEESAARKRPTRTRRLIGSTVLASLLIVAVIVITPKQLKRLLPHPHAAPAARVASSPVDPGPLPVVQAAWAELSLKAMPADVAQDLESGKYYYDKRFPGNFGLAISYWEQALARPGGADREDVQTLVASAERELAGQFTRDSGDVIVLLKQGKKDLAVVLLDKMRADYLDIAAPQYRWASVMLSRYRR